MKYSYLLLDLDGTVTDSMTGITRSVQYALKHFGIEIKELSLLQPFIGPPLKDSFKEFYHFLSSTYKCNFLGADNKQ